MYVQLQYFTSAGTAHTLCPGSVMSICISAGSLFVVRAHPLLLCLLLTTILAAHLQVQLQLLTATVKLFLKKPTDNVQRMIQLVLSCATNETDNPDLRDRAYVYWRLLSTDPEVRNGRQQSHAGC